MADDARALDNGVAPASTTFVTGAIILVAGSLGSRVLGATYRIIIPILMGGGTRAATGMGLYQIAYPIFLLAVTLITTGFPLAISKIVAARLADGDEAGAQSVFAAARLVLPACGFVLALVMWLIAPWIARNVAHDLQAVITIRAISPAVFTSSFAAPYRGAYQGMQNMRPYAISQIIEQIGRIATMFILVIVLLPFGIPYAAAGISLGTVVGGFFAFGTVLWYWRRSHLRSTPHVEHRPVLNPLVLGEIFALAIPIALSASILPLLSLSDAIIVPLRLVAAGMGHQAIALYGVLTGYATPLIMAPSVFTASLSMSLLPSVSASLARGNRQAGMQSAASGLRLAVLFALPAATGLALLAGVLPRILFHASDAARPMLALAPALVFLCLQQTSSGVLRGLGRPDISVRNLVAGGVVKVGIAWWLVALPAWNISGDALSTSIAYGIACTLNITAVAHRLPGVVDWRHMVFRPLIAAASMTAAVLVVEKLLATHGLIIEAAGAVIVGVVAYVVVIVLVRGIRRSDLELVPRVGRPAARALARWGLL